MSKLYVCGVQCACTGMGHGTTADYTSQFSPLLLLLWPSLSLSLSQCVQYYVRAIRQPILWRAKNSNTKHHIAYIHPSKPIRLNSAKVCFFAFRFTSAYTIQVCAFTTISAESVGSVCTHKPYRRRHECELCAVSEHCVFLFVIWTVWCGIKA